MPPKKRKRKPTQSQSQRQSVVVNIGSKTSKPRKKSGRGGLPPPSYQHNLAPTFVTAPQVDYTPLLAMIQHHARPIVEQAPMPITQTPLSASVQATNAEQMAGEAAIRRAGPTAANFQPPPSQSRDAYGFPEPVVKSAETLRQEFAYLAQQASLKEKQRPQERTGLQQAEEAIGMVQQALRPPDPYVTQQLVPTKSAEDLGPDYAGGGLSTAESRPKRGRPKRGTQVATLVGEPPIQAEIKKGGQKDISEMFKRQGL
jgi:hypothetical protein